MSHMEVLNSQVRNFSLVDQRSTFLGAEASVWSEGIDSRKEYISFIVQGHFSSNRDLFIFSKVIFLQKFFHSCTQLPSKCGLLGQDSKISRREMQEKLIKSLQKCCNNGLAECTIGDYQGLFSVSFRVEMLSQ